jgi:hemolysin-activating ACP:hemolysin acyltransferase
VTQLHETTTGLEPAEWKQIQYYYETHGRPIITCTPTYFSYQTGMI